MKLLLAPVFAIVLHPSLAMDCMDAYNSKKCLSKAEMGEGWGGNFVGGDPCVVAFGGRYCFIDKRGSMHPCKCEQVECGCGPPPPPPPKCDNSKVPNSFPLKCGQGWGEDNTMCQYTKMGDGCGPICNRDLTADEKKIILDKHNELRRRVAVGNETINNQPSAANMKELIWDDELAVSAQRWTDQCIFGHDDNRRTSNYDFVGQNAAYFSSTQNSAVTDFAEFVQIWYDEVKDFKSSTEKFTDQIPPNTDVVAHYTQVVWAKTKKVGCGFVHIDEGNGVFKKLINCNYYPTGNWLGEPVYEKGAAGSNCARDNNGLCA